MGDEAGAAGWYKAEQKNALLDTLLYAQASAGLNVRPSQIARIQIGPLVFILTKATYWKKNEQPWINVKIAFGDEPGFYKGQRTSDPVGPIIDWRTYYGEVVLYSDGHRYERHLNDRPLLGTIRHNGFSMADKRARHNSEVTKEHLALIRAVRADPEAEVLKHGRVTGRCACCGAKLQGENLERGINIACLERYGFSTIEHSFVADEADFKGF